MDSNQILTNKEIEEKSNNEILFEIKKMEAEHESIKLKMLNDYDKMIELENLIRSQKHEINFKKSVKISKYIDDEHFTISIRTDCPAEYWYHDHIGEEFLVTNCTYLDLREVEGFSNKEPSDCFKVMDGEKKGSIILKEHCNYIW